MRARITIEGEIDILDQAHLDHVRQAYVAVVCLIPYHKHDVDALVDLATESGEGQAVVARSAESGGSGAAATFEIEEGEGRIGDGEDEPDVVPDFGGRR